MPLPEIKHVESKVNTGDAIEPEFASTAPKNLTAEPAPVIVPLFVRFP